MTDKQNFEKDINVSHKRIIDRYRKALEEIEPILEFYGNSFINPLYHPDVHYDNKPAKRGLDIINKAKGEEKCQ